MPIILAACFLFIFCSGHHHKSPSRVADRNCDKIVAAYHFADKSRDDFVSSYPVARQHRVLVCLDKAGGQ